MLKIYGFELSMPANRVRMAVNAMGLEHEYIRVDLSKGEQKSPEHMRLHPAGKVPAMDDDGFALFESGAILRYLCRKSGSDYYPAEPQGQALADQWGDFAVLHVQAPMSRVLFNKIIAPRVGLEVDERSMQTGYEFLEQSLPVAEAQLGKADYLAGGRMTIADFCLLAAVDPADAIGLDLGQYRRLAAWRKALVSQAFYRDVHAFFGAGMLERQ
ncbi:MAG: glutathione S-transferase family protein [Gammaproteobacteria bacterium]|nr:glutathione S-transferase family protein [Gammaproteobacteria bacterium]MDD9824804.1 glutathione S-transferase family protein [Gammaproteobacteria bacterium]MDD9864331.1 glutathione S-transferase family protein [Gammaproteobacteria bacterium]